MILASWLLPVVGLSDAKGMFGEGAPTQLRIDLAFVFLHTFLYEGRWGRASVSSGEQLGPHMLSPGQRHSFMPQPSFPDLRFRFWGPYMCSFLVQLHEFCSSATGAGVE